MVCLQNNVVILSIGLLLACAGGAEVGRAGEPVAAPFAPSGSSRAMLENLQAIVEGGQPLPSDNPAGQLPWLALYPSGWRWEGMVDEHRVILAIDRGVMVAIRTGKYSGIDMSLMNLNERAAGKVPSPMHVQAMSQKHLSRVAPEMHQIYGYFAGPSRTLVRSQAVLPSWLDAGRR